MGQLVVDEDRFAAMLAELRPHLNELQWRLLLGAQARSLGRGGIKRVALVAGVHPDTVGRGARELEQGAEPDGRVRRAGAGRPRAGSVDPNPEANTSDRYRTLTRLPACLDRGAAFVTARCQHLPPVVVSAACCWGSRLFQTPRRRSTTGTAPDAAAAQASAPRRTAY
jgi:hypothetical protein